MQRYLNVDGNNAAAEGSILGIMVGGGSLVTTKSLVAVLCLMDPKRVCCSANLTRSVGNCYGRRVHCSPDDSRESSAKQHLRCSKPRAWKVVCFSKNHDDGGYNIISLCPCDCSIPTSCSI